MIVEIALCGVAAALFGRGLYHSGVLTGWIAQGLRDGDDHCAACQDAGVCLHNGRCQKPEPAPRFDPDEHERNLFLATGAWWLDPNRWGDNPNWRENLPRPVAPPYLDADPPIPALAPRCPVCGPDGQVAVLNTAGNEVTLWDCFKCGAEFTRRGETKKSRKARLAREARALAEIERNEKSRADHRLPCGCEGDVVTRAYPTGGWDMGRYAECKTCRGTWDYAEKYGESGNPRRMHPRSGPVEWPNGNPLTQAEISPPSID